MSGPVQFTFANAKEAAPGATRADLDEAPEPQYAPARRAAPSQSKPLAPKNIVQLAKARLKEVKVELKRMTALEKERTELERLIEAAEAKPRAVVRELKPKASAG